jgi:hypothetical protein
MPFAPRRSVLGFALFALCSWESQGADGAAWKTVDQSANLTVYERPRSGSALREYKAVGIIEAAPGVVRRVLDDVTEYPTFMPYVKEARIISQGKGSRVTYQRLSPPVVGDRDYTVRVAFETRRTPSGILSYFNRWHTANEAGPTEQKGVTRVSVVEGSWLLEPFDRTCTRATYSVFSDAGGLPAMIANVAGKSAIPRVFASIRKQVQLPKYQAPN